MKWPKLMKSLTWAVLNGQREGTEFSEPLRVQINSYASATIVKHWQRTNTTTKPISIFVCWNMSFPETKLWLIFSNNTQNIETEKHFVFSKKYVSYLMNGFEWIFFDFPETFWFLSMSKGWAQWRWPREIDQ